MPRTNEAATKGVINALLKGRNHTVCGSCGFPVPKYPGRYPSKCPSCGKPLNRSK